MFLKKISQTTPIRSSLLLLLSLLIALLCPATFAASNQENGKPYVKAEGECMPDNIEDVSSISAQALYGCLLGEKYAIRGSKSGYKYLSYVHAFWGRRHYLFNFIINGQNIILKSQYLGDSGEKCVANEKNYLRSDYLGDCAFGRNDGENCWFNISGQQGQLLISENCDKTGDRYLSETRKSLFSLNDGEWELTQYKFDSSGGDIDGLHNTYVHFIDWKTKQHCSGSSSYRTRTGLESESSSFEFGIITNPKKVTIRDFYRKYKLMIKSSFDVRGKLLAKVDLKRVYMGNLEMCRKLAK